MKQSQFFLVKSFKLEIPSSGAILAPQVFKKNKKNNNFETGKLYMVEW